MTYSDAYNYLLSLSNFPRQEYMNDPKKCVVYLQRMQYLLDILGNPEKKIPHYIHITGTSGKGSITAYMHSILHKAKYSVGSTYSPHPSTIEQRWRVGNRNMSKKEFVALVQKLKPALDEYIKKSPHQMPSFFEITEAIGFMWFAELGVEWVVLEVGCGGRFDSSNIIPHKDVAIISNIGLDHVGIIGNNKKEIAYEKAGIIKKNSHVITGEKNKALYAIIEKEASSVGALSITRVSPKQAYDENISIHGTGFSYQKNSYMLPIAGNHQIHNALICIEAAKKINIPPRIIQQGLASAKQTLRLEVISDHPLQILDGAHNTDKMNSTVETLLHIQKQSPQRWKDIHLVLGFSHNKQLSPMLRALAKLQPKTVACTRNSINSFRKVASPADIAAMIHKLSPNTKTEIFTDPKDAFTWGKKQQKATDCLLVTGSIFLSGEIRAIVRKD